jgi:hypothetical protein
MPGNTALSLTTLTVSSISERLNASGSTGPQGSYVVTLDYSTGSVFYLNPSPALTANFTVNIINLGSAPTGPPYPSQTLALIYNNTGSSHKYCGTVNAYTGPNTGPITLTSATPLYSGGTAPTITSATLICQIFSIIRGAFATNYCITNIVNYA